MNANDCATGRDSVMIGANNAVRENGKWHCKWRVEKFFNTEEQDIIGKIPDEVFEDEGNLLMNGGVSCLFQSLIGNGTGTAAQTLTFFNNANAYIGVGDSNTAAAATQTDLQAASNKTRQGMVATYPQHTDGTTSGSQTITFQATFGTSAANYAWQEWAVFNGSSGGRMLNRAVSAMGTKASGSTWTITATITIS